MDHRRDRVGWIIVGVLLLALLVVGLLWMFGAFAGPQLSVLPTSTVLPKSASPAPTATASLTPTFTVIPSPTLVVQATPAPPRAPETKGMQTVCPNVGVGTGTPAPPFRQEPLAVGTPTETPIVLDGGVEAGFPP